MTRRDLLKAGLLLGGAVAIDTFAIEPREPVVERLTVGIRGLPRPFEGFTICQITDVHHGPIVPRGYVEEVVRRANALGPDLMVLTGDYIDQDREYVAPCLETLSGLRSPNGITAVLGNHDHFVGGEYSARAVRDHGIRLLRNEHYLIEKGGEAVCIAGTRDYYEDVPDAGLALRRVPEDIPRILLNHHPDYCEYLPPGERIDLIISGHTHGGQVRVPVAGYAPIVPSSFGQKYSGGLVRLKRRGETPVYVSRGVGVVFLPMRFNCPPEITLVTLRRTA